MLGESYTPHVQMSDHPGMVSLAFGADSNFEPALAVTEDVAELKRKYSGFVIQLDRLRSDLIGVDVHFRPSPKEWSTLEILGHLIDADRDIWWPRITAILSEENPHFVNIDQNELVRKHNWHSLPLEDILSQLMRIRWNYAMEMNSIPLSSFDRTGEHAILGEVSIFRILQILVAHDAHYLDKIRSLINQFPATPRQEA